MRLPKLVIAVALAGATAALPATATTTQATSGAQAAPVVRIPFPQDDGTLTPYTFEVGYSLMTLVYDTLLWRDADGVAQPWLAESVDRSSDGLRLTLHLAGGVRWHDGSALTASDVAFTFRHFAADFHPRFTDELEAVRAVTAPDDSTVVITLTHPSPGFADQPLADLPILPEHLWAALPEGRHAPEGLPVGSGPYRLVEYRPGASYRFDANTSYFRGAPAVSGIEVPIIRSSEDTFQALERSRVDMVPLTLPEGLVGRVRRAGGDLLRGTTYGGTGLLFNVRQPPFDNADVRRAISSAIDLNSLVTTVPRAVAADRGYIHPESPFASPAPLHAFDEAAARRVLDGADLKFDLLAPDNDPIQLEAATQVKRVLQRVGVEVSVKNLSRVALSRAVGEDGASPDFQAAIWETPSLASYDPDFLRRVFGSGRAGEVLNHSGYASSAFDDAAERITRTTDVEARKAAAAEALKIVSVDAPLVPLFFAPGTFAYRPTVYRGWVFIKGAGILDKRSFVEPVARPAPSPRLGTASSSEGERSPFVWIAIALAGIAGLLVVFSIVRAVRLRGT